MIAVRAFIVWKKICGTFVGHPQISFQMESCPVEAHVSARGQQANLKRIAVNASLFPAVQPAAKKM